MINSSILCAILVLPEVNIILPCFLEGATPGPWSRGQEVQGVLQLGGQTRCTLQHSGRQGDGKGEKTGGWVNCCAKVE